MWDRAHALMRRVGARLQHNARDLLVPPPGVQVLHGIRALACVWVVAFHALGYAANFMAPEQFAPLRDHWSLSWCRLGNSAVDVFFVLTGFVLAWPLFVKEFRLNGGGSTSHAVAQALDHAHTNNGHARANGVPGGATAAAAAAGTSVSPRTTGRTLATTAASTSHLSFVASDGYDESAFRSTRTGTWWYRRFVVRIYPPLVTVLFVYCVLLFPRGLLMPWDRLGSSVARDTALLRSGGVDPGTHMRTLCLISPLNLTFLNNLVPFGGCMGWTWSLAVQGQVYFVFPWLVRRVRRARRLLVVCGALMLLHLLWRVYRLSTLRDWYGEPVWTVGRVPESSTDPLVLQRFTDFSGPINNQLAMRLGAFLVGVGAAYVHARIVTSTPAPAAAPAAASADQPQPQQSHTSSQSASSSARLANALFALPDVVHVGLLALCAVVLVWNSGHDVPHRAVDGLWFLTFVYIGGPLWPCAVAYVILLSAHRTASGQSGGRVARALHAFFSARVWIPIAKLSYGVYLFHLVWLQKGFSVWFWPVPPTVWFVWFSAVLFFAVSLVSAAVMFVVIEKPAADCLARAEPQVVRACCRVCRVCCCPCGGGVVCCRDDPAAADAAAAAGAADDAPSPKSA